jgi:hypothetical protein
VAETASTKNNNKNQTTAIATDTEPVAEATSAKENKAETETASTKK